MKGKVIKQQFDKILKTETSVEEEPWDEKTVRLDNI
jgi:hypothetical protein